VAHAAQLYFKLKQSNWRIKSHDKALRNQRSE